MHFMVMYLLKCQEIAELKAFIQENCDEFSVAVREQIVLLHDFEDKMHESDTNQTMRNEKFFMKTFGKKKIICTFAANNLSL